MSRFFTRFPGILIILAAPLAAESWQSRYLYDEHKSALALHDIAFASPARGVAVGVIEDGRRSKPVALVTTDGGARWEEVPLKETPVSLFFLNENFGWMVTEKGVWTTSEAGKSWRKLPKVPAPVLRVYFTDEKTGWAACAKKTVLETHDGGESWTPVKESAAQPGAPENSGYVWIAFATAQRGIVLGWNQPRRRLPQFPTWMDPEDAASRREMPHLAYQLSTYDGGKTWKSSSISVFGNVTRIRFGPNGLGIGLVEYSESFVYPSEVHKIEWQTGRNTPVFQDKQLAATDVWITKDGTGYVAGIEIRGEIRSGIPGRVKVLRSKDLKVWTAMDVDYRAVAGRATFAGMDANNLWLATDNGMILKLQ